MLICMRCTSSLLVMQVLDTPGDHVTRDYREGAATLADIKFTAIDTSGKPSAWSLCRKQRDCTTRSDKALGIRRPGAIHARQQHTGQGNEPDRQCAGPLRCGAAHLRWQVYTLVWPLHTTRIRGPSHARPLLMTTSRAVAVNMSFAVHVRALQGADQACTLALPTSKT